jgi:hypothetical protein
MRLFFVVLPALVAAGWLAVQGEVRDAAGPVAGARVRYQGHDQAVLTDVAGRFKLPGERGRSKRITAWKAGYTIAAVPADRKAVRLTLTPLPREDHDDYRWIDPTPNPKRPAACGNCHGEIYREWSADAHARAATNRRVLNLLQGRDWHGRPSPTWNLAAEHPLGTAVCATCHAPTLRDPTLAYDLAAARGADARGVHCDYCHKIVDAPTDRLGTRFGRDGLRLLRPADQELLFFGPLDDTYRQGENFGFSSLYRESRYCAACHEGIVFGVHVYGTYSEWLQSPARKAGLECQSCHMAASGHLSNIAPGKGGIERNPRSLASHLFPGGQPDMLRRCLHLAVRLERTATEVRAQVTVTADEVGHRVPTGFIDRNLVLAVEARDGDGKIVPLRAGPRLPPAAGKAIAGRAGWLYAKVLQGPKGAGPVPFWARHGKVADSRLYPGQPDRHMFTFPADVRRVEARLLYRRFWPAVAEAKGWPGNEVLVIVTAAN